jgi:serine/threonine protein kinase
MSTVKNENALPPRTIITNGKVRYVIERELGSGGFGITYLAQRLADGKEQATYCALKEYFRKEICARDVTHSMSYFSTNKKTVEEGIEDFIVEAKRLNKNNISHPNIVHIGDVFKANNTAYYEMEYIQGVDLLRYIKEPAYSGGKPLTEQEGLNIILPVLKAVSLLHEHHITHLDIKHENIILTQNEEGEWRPVLIDFGLSKHYDKKGHATSSLTVAGCTDGFAPTEQYQGLTEFTPQADVYALAATLLFLLSAKWPVKSADINADKIRASLPDTVSQKVVEAIVSAMRADKNERTKSVAEFANDLGLDICTNVTMPIEIRGSASVLKNLRKQISSLSASLIDFDYRKLIKPISFTVLAGIFLLGAWHIWPTTDPDQDEGVFADTVFDDAEYATADTVFDDAEYATADTVFDDVEYTTANTDFDNVSPVKPEKVVATEETKPTNDELYAKAQTLSDYKRLADNGYRKAYANLADLYLKQRNYKSADTYVRKAFAARSNLALATSVADMLDKLGWYDDPKNGSKPQ